MKNLEKRIRSKAIPHILESVNNILDYPIKNKWKESYNYCIEAAGTMLALIGSDESNESLCGLRDAFDFIYFLDDHSSYEGKTFKKKCKKCLKILEEMEL